MSVRRLVLVALTASSLLAGCSSPAGAPVDEPAPTTIRYTSCAEHIGRFPAPVADVRASIPIGFEPAPFPGDPTGQFGVVALLTVACAEGGPAEHLDADVRDAWALALVTPPPEHKDPGTDAYLAFLAGISTSEPISQALRAWGFPATRGERAQEETLSTPVARQGFSLADDGAWSVRLDTSVTGPAAAADGSTRYRIFAFDPTSRELTGALDLRWTDPLGMGGEARLEAETPEGPLQIFSDLGPGTGAHYWGPDYDAELIRVALHRKAPPAGHSSPQE